MRRPEQAKAFLEKAAEDELMLDLLLLHPSAPVTGLGFHAQQAAEKMLKALILALGGRLHTTHDLTDLMETAESLGAKMPEHLQELRALTPVAVRLRYDLLPEPSQPSLDRTHVRELLRELRTWVESRIQADA